MFSICRHSRTGPGSCLTGKFEFHLAVAPDEMEGLINIYLQNYTIQTNLAPAKQISVSTGAEMEFLNVFFFLSFFPTRSIKMDERCFLSSVASLIFY